MNRSFINCYMVSTISSSPIHLGVPNHLPTEHEDLASQSKRFGLVGRVGFFSNSTGRIFSKNPDLLVEMNKMEKMLKIPEISTNNILTKTKKKKHVSSTDLGAPSFLEICTLWKSFFSERQFTSNPFPNAKKLLHLSQACLRNHVGVALQMRLWMTSCFANSAKPCLKHV